jgi:uncharacterized protein YodC (DUF2158 family)
MDCFFNVGDVVRMKSDGVEMTVIRVLGKEKEDKFVFIDRLGYEEGDIICEWSDGENKKYDVFKRTNLETVRKSK